MEINVEISQKNRIELPYNPAIPFLGIYLKEYKSEHPRATFTSMFIVTPFTVTKL
jgi:hypothetical protein